MVKLFFFLICLSTYADNFLDSGSWFTAEEKFRNGFEFQSLYLKKSYSKNKFILSKISYNKIKLWEETRINGVIEKLGEDYILKAENTSVFASKKLGSRWILFRSVDSDHLKQKLILKNNSVELESFFDPGKIDPFYSEYPKNQNLVYTKLIHEDEDFYFVWGIEIRRLKKSAKIIFDKKKIGFDEIVDSTAKIKKATDLFLKRGDILPVENSTSSDLFD
jgi:hypothetical protein